MTEPAPYAQTNLTDNIFSAIKDLTAGDTIFDIQIIGEFTLANLAFILLIAALVFIAAKITAKILRKVLSGKVEAKNTDGIIKLITGILIFIGLLSASPQLHIDLSGLLVAGGVIGIAIGFASQNTLSNFISGIILMIERPVGKGDIVIINNTEGYIESVGLISSRIRTYNGLVLRIPNASVFSAEITNCVFNVARRFGYTFDIRYTDNAETALKIIYATVDKHPYALSEPAPSIFVDALGEHGIQITVKIWSPSPYWWKARTDLLWQIFKELRKGGIDIPFNQITVWYGEKNADKLMQNITTDKDASEILEMKPEKLSTGAEFA